MNQNRRQTIAAFFALLPLLALIFSGWMHPCFHGSASHSTETGEKHTYHASDTHHDAIIEQSCPICTGFFKAAETSTSPEHRSDARQLTQNTPDPQVIEQSLPHLYDARAPPFFA